MMKLMIFPSVINHLSDELVLLLFAGVGIYQPSSKILTNLYTRTVMNMASSGKLAFIISDDSISHGINVPISHVIVTKEFAQRHSLGTILQFMGRGARLFVSWSTQVHIDSSFTVRFLNFSRGATQEHLEANNLNKAYCGITSNIPLEEENEYESWANLLEQEQEQEQQEEQQEEQKSHIISEEKSKLKNKFWVSDSDSDSEEEQQLVTEPIREFDLVDDWQDL